MRLPPHLTLLQQIARQRGQAQPPSNPSQPTGVAGATNHLLAPTLDERLAAVPGTAHGSVLTDRSLLPRGRFLQNRGPRIGQYYRIVQGDSGRPIRVYETGDTALATGSPQHRLGADQRQPTVLRQGEPALQDPAAILELLRRFGAQSRP